MLHLKQVQEQRKGHLKQQTVLKNNSNLFAVKQAEPTAN